jgi:lipopolysaccharide transport system ATP-binding protein
MSYLHVHNLRKAYKRYASKWGRLAEWLGGGTQHELHWVLRDVNLDINPGEAVGIVGANGAGKSTLLKLITGAIRPTTGAYETAGRVAALLELGIGFQPDFTGRQNVFMAAHLRGIPTEQINALMADIAAFSEIGDFLDEPVRTSARTSLEELIASMVEADLRRVGREYVTAPGGCHT